MKVSFLHFPILKITLVLIGVASMVLSSCNKEASRSTETDSSSRTVSTLVRPTDSVGAAAYDSTHAIARGATASSSAPVDATGYPMDTAVHVLDSNDPIAQKLLNKLREQQAERALGGKLPSAGVKIVHGQDLVALMPKFPGYNNPIRVAPAEAQGFSRAVAQYKLAQDTSKSIRVVVSDVNENAPSPYAAQRSQLEASGHVSDNSQGETITAYLVHVNGIPAAKTYIPSKHVATLTIFVSPYRIMQLREDQVNSADHLVEMARYLDTKKYQTMK